MRVLETWRPLQIKPSGSVDENACISDNNKPNARAFVRACEK